MNKIDVTQHCFICSEHKVEPGQKHYPCCSADHRELWKHAQMKTHGFTLSYSGTIKARKMGMDPKLLARIKHKGDEV